MDRIIVYPGALPLDSDVLNTNKNTMLALAGLLNATLGTTSTVAGLAGTQTTVPSLTINIGPGSITSLQNVDNTQYGSIALDTTDTIVKQGVNLTTTQLTLTAPGTAGFSQNYLIEASFVEADATPVALPYYNATNPAQPYSGPANTGATQNTLRTQRVLLQAVAGVAATTGTQTTPATGAGNVPLYVVTVAYGQTAITTAQIVAAPLAPFVDGLAVGRGIQPGRLLNIQTISATGTYNPTPGATKRLVKLWGASGGSGGAAATTSAQVSLGAGGGGGAYCEDYGPITGPVSVTIGAAGSAGAAGGAGGSGGQSKFGTGGGAPTAPGGLGGGSAPATAPFPILGYYGFGAAVATNGSVLNQSGGGGSTVTATSIAGFLSGPGGFSGSGSPGANPISNASSVGNAASSPGAGPSGSANGPSQSAIPGVAGTNGQCIIFEYS
jgi:hypothetical protein